MRGGSWDDDAAELRSAARVARLRSGSSKTRRFRKSIWYLYRCLVRRFPRRASAARCRTPSSTHEPTQGPVPTTSRIEGVDSRKSMRSNEDESPPRTDPKFDSPSIRQLSNHFHGEQTMTEHAPPSPNADTRREFLEDVDRGRRRRRSRRALGQPAAVPSCRPATTRSRSA